MVALVFDQERNMLLSAARDKTVHLNNVETGTLESAFNTGTSVVRLVQALIRSTGVVCTTLQYDKETQNVFVGDTKVSHVCLRHSRLTP